MAIRKPKPLGDGVFELELGCGNVTLISECDAEKVCVCNWHSSTNGRDLSRYVKGRLKTGSSLLRLHRFLLDVTDSSLQVDHINKNTLDNRRENLRIVSQSENMANAKRGGARPNYRRLTPDEIQQIVECELSAKQIAAMHYISVGYVHMLRTKHGRVTEAAS